MQTNINPKQLNKIIATNPNTITCFQEIQRQNSAYEIENGHLYLAHPDTDNQQPTPPYPKRKPAIFLPTELVPKRKYHFSTSCSHGVLISNLLIVSVYLPTGCKEEEYQACLDGISANIIAVCSRFSVVSVVVGGDFQSTMGTVSVDQSIGLYGEPASKYTAMLLDFVLHHNFVVPHTWQEHVHSRVPSGGTPRSRGEH